MCLLDRNILPVLAEPIKRDLHLSDTQVGLITGVTFGIFYSVFGLPIASMADRLGRVRVMAAACLLWSGFTGFCGLAGNFYQLALMRIGVAIGESGCTPSSYSLISDYFPKHQRGMAIAIFCLGAPLGIAAGALIAGFVGGAWGWRFALGVAALPGIAISGALILLVKEPRQGRLDLASEDYEKRHSTIVETIHSFMRTPLLLRIGIAGAFASIVNYSTLSWMPPFLMRSQGMALEDIGRYYSVLSAGTMAVGMLIGGWWADKAARAYPQAYALIPAVGFLVGTPFFLVSILSTTWEESLILFIVPGISVGLFGAPSGAVIQNYSEPHQRSVINAIYVFIVVVTGLGLGPLYVGMISDWAGNENSAEGLRWGMLGILPFYLGAAIAFYWASRALRLPRIELHVGAESRT